MFFNFDSNNLHYVVQFNRSAHLLVRDKLAVAFNLMGLSVSVQDFLWISNWLKV